MRIVIIEINDEIAESLKRALSLKFKCLIEKIYDTNSLYMKYKGSNCIFIINACIGHEKEINEEGIKLAHFVKEKLKLKTLVFGAREREEDMSIPYLRIPFLLIDIHKEISKPKIPRDKLDKELLIDRYEYFRSKISHDYLQYSTKHWRFFRYLLLNFYKYTKLIFGINLEDEKGIKKEIVVKVIKKYEEQRDFSVLHTLMRELKLKEIRDIQFIKSSELKGKFFTNLEILIKVLEDKVKAPVNLGDRIAENFFLSWYLWRELCFLDKYNPYFSDGFYKGCFRTLLSYNQVYYQDVKRKTLLTMFESSDISDSIDHIKLKIGELEDIFTH